MTTSADLRSARQQKDLAAEAGRLLFLIGLFMLSLTTFRIGGFTIGDILLLASLVFAILARIDMHDQKYIVPSGMLIAVVAIVVGGLVSTAASVAVGDSFLVIVRLVIVIAVIPWQATTLWEHRRHIRTAAASYAAGGAVAGLGCVLQGLFGITIRGSEVTQAGRFPGFTQNVSDAGGITSVAVLLCLYFLTSSHGFWRRLVWLVLIGCAAAGLILSGSVAGLVAVGVALLALILRRALKIRYMLLIVIVVVGVFITTNAVQSAFGALTPVERIMQVFGATGRYSTAENRLDTYSEAFNRIIASPFSGAGMDGYSGVVDGGFQAHNLFVAALYQGGVFVFLGITIVLLRPFGSWLRSDRTYLASYILAASLGAITFAMTAPSMFNRYLWIPLMFLLLVSRHPPVVGDRTPLMTSTTKSGRGKVVISRQTVLGVNDFVSADSERAVD